MYGNKYERYGRLSRRVGVQCVQGLCPPQQRLFAELAGRAFVHTASHGSGALSEQLPVEMARKFLWTTVLLACLLGSTASAPAASRRSLQSDLDVPRTATPTPPPSSLEPQPEVAKDVSQPDCDDSEASRELLSRMRELQDELAVTQQATQQAADAKQFTEAAEHQAREVELTAERDNLRSALIALCGDPRLLETAADIEAVVSRTWQRRLDEMTGPMEAAINTTIAIVQQSLRHAAEAGHTGIQIGEPNLYTRAYVPADCTDCYVVNLG